ncbi:MAG: helix-turn-helix domain-containing protein [Planctomycetia bacterium]|nr:helix-turn-helix domain-containing protein [Planctomycetia bacterium]
MNTYHSLSGLSFTYPDPPPDVAVFLERVRLAAADPAVSPNQLIELIYGLENPLLEETMLPGRAMVTQAVFDNPIYRIMTDLLDRKELAAANQTVEQVAAPYTISVKQAAKKLGITESSVRAAITARKLSAWMRNGQWFLRPESIASYKLSNGGRKKRKAKPAPSAASVKRKRKTK